MKKAIVILLAILSLLGTFGCALIEDKPSEDEQKLINRIMTEVNRYNERDTVITVHHAYKDTYIVIAVHKYNEKQICVDTYTTYRNAIGYFGYTLLDQAVYINKVGGERDNEQGTQP